MNHANHRAILCVDDEPQVLAGMQLYLRRDYEVLTAQSGADGLDKLKQRRDVVAIVSDMRMPGMDGASFLREARKLVPDAPRLLLTGNADLDSAIAAVNEGNIFRFLLKPSTPDVVRAALDAACAQYQLVTAERVLLGNTLNGTIKTLTDVLAMTNPRAFGTASRIKLLAGEIAARMLPSHRWAVELAAMLAPLGSITLPDSVVEKIYGRQELTLEERGMVERLPAITDSLLVNIPRLEPVRAMLGLIDNGAIPADLRFDTEQQTAVRRGADVLRLVLDFDALDADGNATEVVIGTLRARGGRYDPHALEALGELRGEGGIVREIREVPLHGLREGMIIASDIRLASGVLLVARGFEVTQSFVERVRNLRLAALMPPVKIYATR